MKCITFNEIAWMGTEESSSDEWIELYNSCDNKIDLSTYSIKTEKLNIELTGYIEDYYLLERSDDNTLPHITADAIYKGGLKNTGEILQLINNNIVEDEILSWEAGDNENKRTMERNNNGWQTSVKIGGTPKEKNSEIIKREIEPINIENNNTNFSMLFIGFLIATISLFVIILINKTIKKYEWT